jgi:uncharacterized protein YndB with AHSA1/START domain
MFYKAVLTLATLFGIGAIGLGISVSRQPSEVTISRSQLIPAPVEKVFPYLEKPALNLLWMPWAEMDPSAQWSVSGPEAGVGARLSWSQGKEMGKGSSSIIEHEPLKRVRMKLQYEEPLSMVQDAEFLAKKLDDSNTEVTWRVTYTNDTMGKIVHTLFGLETQLGNHFASGLAKLRAAF